MDPNEGRRYIEPMKDEVFKGWDHAYNISEEYIYLTNEGENGWHRAISAYSESNDALKNWQNCMHEVSFRKCGLITQSLRHVATEMVEFPVYEGLFKLSALSEIFEERVLEPQ